MKLRYLALLIPLAACDPAPASEGIMPLSVSVETPVAAGSGDVRRFYRVYGSVSDTTVVLAGDPALPIRHHLQRRVNRRGAARS